MARIHLHIDGVVLFLAGTVVYGILGFSWGLYAALILAPDLFMLGYLAGPRTGAAIYNIGHSLFWPAAFVLAGLLIPSTTLLSVGIIWACHLGMDHAFGYGFKYPDAFKHTHFAEV